MAETLNSWTVGDRHNLCVGTTLASADTITPTARVHPVSGSTQIKNIALPWPGFQGDVVLLPTDSSTFTTATGGTAGTDIKLATSAVRFKALHMTYDGSSWWPSY